MERASHVLVLCRRYYDHSLLSAESYFHIIAYNSEFCSRFISSNLRFANWRGSLGCKCQYKHLVDWCGCSPNVFIADDLRLLKSLPSAPNFFARKFDGRVSDSVIHDCV
ncbi:hypothetical protein PTSG_04030 [Salpingoeca rosetta]|uniref:Protein xylosyltransferase n=1 Tax=Salpingoeca rosetta (strain ATCC 50818 / BSB-021) TaxID=946362 RepID=F2U7K5_SALR5|nr:uncharacterized protein PTSG_04030 [Salpingoeca rosetta]EGD83422.1 hypothetical protein PTSG_04030 [Salpingoeca rosetta]|eukprot:XP_004994926.1 hypothetical protein PTSG_04030 [Salpingoeca rosetta]